MGEVERNQKLCETRKWGNLSQTRQSTHIQQLGRVDPVVVGPPGDHMTSHDNLHDNAALVLPQRAREGWFGRRWRAEWTGGTGNDSGRSRGGVDAETTLRQGRKIRATMRPTCVCRNRYSAGVSTGETLLGL